MQNSAAGHGSDDGKAQSSAIASNCMDAPKGSPPTLVVAGGQQQEQAHSAKARFQELIVDPPGSIFNVSLPKDGGPPWRRPPMTDIVNASRFVDCGSVVPSAATPLTAAPKAIGGSAPHMPVPSIFQFGGATADAKPPPPQPPPANKNTPGAKPGAMPPPPPPPNPGNVVAPQPAPHVEEPRPDSSPPPAKGMPKRPLQQEGRVDLQGSLAPGARVAEPKAAVAGTLGAEVEAGRVVAPSPAPDGPAPSPNQPWQQQEGGVDSQGSLAAGAQVAEAQAAVVGTLGAEVEAGRVVAPAPAPDGPAQPPNQPLQQQEGGVDSQGSLAAGAQVAEAQAAVGGTLGAEVEAERVAAPAPASDGPAQDHVLGNSGNHGWDGWDTESHWGRWNFGRAQPDVIADDHGGRREPQQDQNRFVLMIHGRKLHRPVLFS